MATAKTTGVTQSEFTASIVVPILSTFLAKTTQALLDTFSYNNVSNIFSNAQSRAAQIRCSDGRAPAGRFYNITNDMMLNELLCRSRKEHVKKLDENEIGFLSTIINANLDAHGKPYFISMPSKLATEKQQNATMALMVSTIGNALGNSISAEIQDKYKDIDFYGNKISTGQSAIDAIIKPIFLGATSTIALVTGVSVYKSFYGNLDEIVKKKFDVLFTKVAELQKEKSDINDNIDKLLTAFKTNKETEINQRVEAKRLELIQKVKAGENPSITLKEVPVYFKVINNITTKNKDQIKGWEKLYKGYYRNIIIAELEKENRFYDSPDVKLLMDELEVKEKQIKRLLD